MAAASRRSSSRSASLVGGLAVDLRRAAPRQRVPRSRAGSIRSTASITGCSRSSKSFSNSRFFNLMFGDSVFIEPYLRFVGWKLGARRSDGLEFRQRAGPGQSVPLLGRRRTRSPRTACGSATSPCRATPSGSATAASASATSSAPSVYVPPGRAHRRQCPLRHQGDGADRRAGARERRPARLARLRDPARRLRATSRCWPRSARPSGRGGSGAKTLLNVASIAGLLASRWLVAFIGSLCLRLDGGGVRRERRSRR